MNIIILIPPPLTHSPPQGGQLVRAPSMTLSESQAMDTFEFLGSEDNILARRFSRTSIDVSEGEKMADGWSCDLSSVWA